MKLPRGQVPGKFLCLNGGVHYSSQLIRRNNKIDSWCTYLQLKGIIVNKYWLKKHAIVWWWKQKTLKLNVNRQLLITTKWGFPAYTYFFCNRRKSMVGWCFMAVLMLCWVPTHCYFTASVIIACPQLGSTVLMAACKVSLQAICCSVFISLPPALSMFCYPLKNQKHPG